MTELSLAHTGRIESARGIIPAIKNEGRLEQDLGKTDKSILARLFCRWCQSRAPGQIMKPEYCSVGPLLGWRFLLAADLVAVKVSRDMIAVKRHLDDPRSRNWLAARETSS